MVERLTFISRISKTTGKYMINIPAKYRKVAEKLHGKYIRVTIELLEDDEDQVKEEEAKIML